MAGKTKTTKPTAATSRAISKGTTQTALLTTANAWREEYNALRGLNVNKARSLRESYLRGVFGDVQWTYRYIEQCDSDLMALVERRTSPLTNMEWRVRVMEDQKEFDPTLAAEQADALKEAYERIDNLYEAITHLALASFRGFSHVEKHRDTEGQVKHLEILDQWNVVRRGFRGPWKINPSGMSVTYESLPSNYILEPQNWIIRETPRHVDWIALMKFVRSNMGQKDWDSFVELYGIPGAVVTGPPNVKTEDEAEFVSSAEAIAKSGSGYLPYGASVQYADGPRGINPFKDYLSNLQQQLILAGTCGLLTMLSQSGTGTLAGSAHVEAFNALARAEARNIGERFQRDIDAEVLEAAFPGQKRLAYFELAGEIEDAAAKQKFLRDVWSGFQRDGTTADIQANLTDMKALTQEVGVPVNEEYTEPYLPVATEKGLVSGGVKKDSEGDIVGGTVDEPSGNGPGNGPGNGQGIMDNGQLEKSGGGTGKEIQEITNREGNPSQITDFAKAVAGDLQPVSMRLENILKIQDEAIFKEKLVALAKELPQLTQDINADPESARVLQQKMAEAAARGIAQKTKNT